MGDLIDREQALSAFDTDDDNELIIRGNGNADVVEQYLKRVMGKIEGLPSAQPERKRGEWLERDVFDEHNITEWQSAKCSVCGHYNTTPYLYSFTYHNFCPYCGADMRRVTE